MARVSIIGLGLVGSALAERLLSAGHSVAGFDIDPARNEALRSVGGEALANSSAAANCGETILLSLPTSDIAAAVLAAIKDELPGKIVLDTTTGQPEQMARLGAELAAMGCDYLDATIAGSSSQVRSGEAIFLLGGPEPVVKRGEKVLALLAKKWFHLGPWGSGARMKLVVNLVLGLNRAVLAEGLAFAKATGVDAWRALEVLKAGPAFSRVMDTKGEKMLRGDFSPQARLAQHHKDVHLILEAANAAKIDLPLSRLHEELLRGLIAAGCGDLDNSAIVKAFTAGEFPRS